MSRVTRIIAALTLVMVAAADANAQTVNKGQQMRWAARCAAIYWIMHGSLNQPDDPRSDPVAARRYEALFKQTIAYIEAATPEGHPSHGKTQELINSHIPVLERMLVERDSRMKQQILLCHRFHGDGKPLGAKL